MKVHASALVKADRSSDGRPSQHDLEEAAGLLQGLGFEVISIGRFAVSFKGESSDFAEVLGISPVPGRTEPLRPDLRDLIDLVEIAPKPTLYAGRSGSSQSSDVQPIRK